MRGRIRQLKPDFFIDDEFWMLEQMHPELPLLRGFQGLWCHADREGRFEWKPLPLKTQIAPYWDGDFAQVLEVLASAGLLACYVVAGRKYGAIRSFKKHQWANPREPASVIPSPPESTDALSEPCATMSRQVPGTDATTPTPLPIPIPTPIPDRTREATVRTYSLPSEQPPKDYLDDAVMGGVSLAQAASTWEHYWGNGLPPNGVERLHSWLVKRAKERATQTSTVPRAGVGKAPGPTWEPNAKHRAFCEEHGLSLVSLAARYVRSGAADKRSIEDANKDFGQRLMKLSRGENDPIIGEAAA